MSTSSLIEIELTNGNHIVIKNNWDKIYNICEKTYATWHLTSRFPFIAIRHHRYTSFKIQEGVYVKTCYDKRYKVNCTLCQFASMFGVKLKSFEQACVEADLKQ